MEQSTKLHETPGIDYNRLLGNTVIIENAKTV